MVSPCFRGVFRKHFLKESGLGGSRRCEHPQAQHMTNASPLPRLSVHRVFTHIISLDPRKGILRSLHFTEQ